MSVTTCNERDCVAPTSSPPDSRLIKVVTVHHGGTWAEDIAAPDGLAAQA